MASSSEMPVIVVGLGRFGGAVADTLTQLGHEVLAVDMSARRVQEWSGKLTHVVEADCTNEAAMRQIGAQEFDRAVVAIGSHLEASILATSLLVDLGINSVWAKATSVSHGRILERVGATRVVFPEHDMGERVGHIVSGQMINYIEFEDGFALVETGAPPEYVGRKLGEAKIRAEHGVTVVCIKRRGEDFTYATPETVIEAGDLLIIAGKTRLTEKFATKTGGASPARMSHHGAPRRFL